MILAFFGIGHYRRLFVFHKHILFSFSYINLWNDIELSSTTLKIMKFISILRIPHVNYLNAGWVLLYYIIKEENNERWNVLLRTHYILYFILVKHWWHIVFLSFFFSKRSQLKTPVQFLLFSPHYSLSPHPSLVLNSVSSLGVLGLSKQLVSRDPSQPTKIQTIHRFFLYSS